MFEFSTRLKMWKKQKTFNSICLFHSKQHRELKLAYTHKLNVQMVVLIETTYFKINVLININLGKKLIVF